MKRVPVLLQFGCALLFIGWAAREIHWENLRATLPAVSMSGAGLLLFFRFVIYTLLGLRLAVLLQGQIPVARTTAAAILCIGCNNILPGRMGELCKIGYLRGGTTLTVPALLGTVTVERGMDVLCLLCLAVLFGSTSLAVHPAWTLLGMGGLIGMGWVLLWKTEFIRTCCRVVPLFPRRWTEELADALAGLRAGRTLPKAGVLSLCIWACNFIHAGLLANVLFPLDLSPRETGILCVVLFGSSALFLIPGGYGLMEGAVTALLLYWGVEKTQALALALWGRLYYSLLPLALSSAIAVRFPSNTFPKAQRQG